MPRQLSGLDATFLGAETATAFMHGVGIIRLGAGDHHPITVEDLRDHVRQRLARLEPLCRQLVTVPGGLDQPWWITVAPDPDHHVSHVRLAASSGRRGFENLCEVIAESPLDRGRPLWHLWLVDGLADGGQALVVKIHHSVSDGVGALAIVAGILDTEPEPPEQESVEVEVEVEPVPDAAWMLARAAAHRARWPLDVARTVLEVGAPLRHLFQLGRHPHPDMAVPLAAPRLAMSGVVSAKRAVAIRELPMDQVKAVAHASGARVNDVILAVLAGSLRRWLLDQDDLPDQALVAAVPVSLRTMEEMADAGNKVSACFVHLDTQISDPAERLRACSEAAAGGKAAHLALGPHVIENFTSLVYPNVVTAGMKAYSGMGLARLHPPAVNLVVSNVAGPPWALYLKGRQVTSLTALGPIFDGVPLDVTAVSSTGCLSIGYIACPDRVPDLPSLADHTQTAFDELLSATGVGS
jgi:WS/DGAT/MGAT family acyltransferase